MSITQEEWREGIKTLFSADESRCDALHIGSGPVIVFRRHLPDTAKPNAIDEAGDQEATEHDPEALQTLQKGLNEAALIVEYRATYSITYQVPVLSLIIRHPDGRLETDLDRVYELLVPETNRSQLRDHGPLGMLTQTENDLGRPAWQLHPCRTQEVMAHLLGGQPRTPERYLALWLGMVGPSVSLVLPDAVRRSSQQVLGVE